MSEENANTYPVHPESTVEFRRLREQDVYYNKHLLLRSPEYAPQFGRDLLPPGFTDAAHPGSLIVDLGCGPGGWILDAARAWPDFNFLGIDISDLMIAYAKNQVIAANIENVQFTQGNFRELASLLGEESVDFLHARFVQWFLPDYLTIIPQWLKSVKPGGVICLTEAEIAHTTSAAYTILYEAMMQALRKRYNIPGTIPQFLKRALTELQVEHLQELAHVINFSAGEADRELFVQNTSHGAQSMAAFVIQSGVMKADMHAMYSQQLRQDMASPAFRGIQFFLTVLGRKSRET